MKTNTILSRLVILIIAFCFTTHAWSQDKIYLPYLTISGMHSDYKVTTTKMLKTYIEANNKYQIILSSTIDSTNKELNITQIQKEATNVGANYFVIGDMNAVGNLLLITVKMYETNTGKLYWNDLLKASSLSDLDPTMQKIANNIGTSTKANADNNIATVTNYESATYNTIKAQYKHCVSIGGGYIPTNVVTTPTNYGISYSLNYDVKKIIFTIDGELLFGNISCQRLSLGILYPLSKNANTPYIGGGLALGALEYTSTIQNSSNTLYPYSETQTHSGAGLEINANGGMLIMRNSAVGMKIGGTISVPTYSVENKVLPCIKLNFGIVF